MRTSLVIDDVLLKKAQEESCLPTIRAVVEAGLAALIREQRRRRLDQTFGRYVWEGDLERMRDDSPVHVPRACDFMDESDVEQRKGLIALRHGPEW